jgi:hypothetical protein
MSRYGRKLKFNKHGRERREERCIGDSIHLVVEIEGSDSFKEGFKNEGVKSYQRLKPY